MASNVEMDQASGKGQSVRSFHEIVQEMCRDLSSMKKASDFIIAMTYCSSSFATIRICIEAGIFRQLAQSSSTLTADELARHLEGVPKAHGEDLIDRTEFVVRMLRMVCALKLVDEAGPFKYRANELTENLADPGLDTGFRFIFDNTMGPQSTISNMLSFFKLNGYKGAATGIDGPYQRARPGATGMSSFQWYVEKDPEALSQLSTYMKRVQQDRLNWDAWFPADVIFDQIESDANDGVFFVDVAGGFGHDLNAFAARYPDRKVRLVLQDLPSVIDEGEDQRRKEGTKLDSRIELSKHDFFKPQPIKAKIYFFHKILHDWPDLDCLTILKHIRDVMDQGARIFANDVILPDERAPLGPVATDITMMSLLSGKERDESMWKRLVSHVDGLTIRRFWYPPEGEGQGEGVVEIVKA